MMNKFDLWKSLLFNVLICLLVWNAFLWLTDPAYRLPGDAKEALFIVFLLWFISAFINSNSNDDWAGEF